MELIPKLTLAIVSSGLVLSCYGISVADCDYDEGTKYPDQSEVCKSGHKYKCEYRSWIDLSEECKNAKPRTDCTCTDDKVNDFISCMCRGRNDD